MVSLSVTHAIQGQSMLSGVTKGVASTNRFIKLSGKISRSSLPSNTDFTTG